MSAYSDSVFDPGFFEPDPVFIKKNMETETGEGFFYPFPSVFIPIWDWSTSLFRPGPYSVMDRVFFIGRNSPKFLKFSFYLWGPIKLDIGQNFRGFPAPT
jgi:hypothetical protein